MNEQALDVIEMLTGGDAAASPVASVVVLHGLGADGRDFVPIVQELDMSPIGPVRFVFPSAPVRPVTINGGYEMRAWYDIFPPGANPNTPRSEDEAGLRQSAAIVQQLLDREVERGVASHRTVLMGFSQGCAMALMAGLRAPNRLAGIVGLSGYLPLADTALAERHPANHHTPVFMGHGEQDPVVEIGRGEASRDALLAWGQAVDWHSYPMEHSVCAEEVSDLNRWLLRVLAPESANPAPSA